MCGLFGIDSKMRKALASMLLSAALALVGQGAFAQHGHPLQGSWSGNWTSGSQQGRLLVLLDFSVDQVISGSIIEDGVRTPISEASLDPDTWSVTLKGEQQAPDGSSAPLEIKGKIENLGSITERSIVGTWRKGTANGAVRLTIN